MSKNKDVVLGVMSGSSLDGLDIAICEVSREHCSIIFSDDFLIDQHLKQRLSKSNKLTPKELLVLEVDFTSFVSKSILEIIEKSKISVDYISFHGHTLLHHPENLFSLQIGNGGLLASLTKLPIICDFRSTDIGLGGTGAPLAPLIDKVVFSEYDFSINLGGIANITSLSSINIIAFDICPCNQLLNYLAASIGLDYDDKGKKASKGSCIKNLFERLSEVEYQSINYPKSLDNDWIKSTYIPMIDEENRSIEDKLNTVVKWISVEISNSIKMILEREKIQKPNYSCILAGGGTNNTFLIKAIQNQLKDQNVSLEIPDNETINFKEAMLMCLLGYYRKHNLNNVFKSVTGSMSDSISGAIYQGVNKII